jgi:hypothetical protein
MLTPPPSNPYLERYGEQRYEKDTHSNWEPADKRASEPDSPTGNPARDLPPAQLPDRAVGLGTHLVGEPAQPVAAWARSPGSG